MHLLKLAGIAEPCRLRIYVPPEDEGYPALETGPDGYVPFASINRLRLFHGNGCEEEEE